MIQPIVEGHGEVEAVPVLLRRLLAEGNVHDIRVGRPFRVRRSELTRKDRLQSFVELAWRQPATQCVAIIFDADDDCPGQLAPEILEWARQVRPGHCFVVMACREYEAWFLASAKSLRGTGLLRRDADYVGDAEGPRGAKQALEDLTQQGRGYFEVADQPRLTAQMDLAAAFSRSRSFRHLVTSLSPTLATSASFTGAWPPLHWL